MTDSRAPSAKPRTGRRAEQAAESRRRLIDAAIDAFSSKDYEDVAVADIAQAAGLAHGLLFHYFGNKRGIYREAMRTVAEQMSLSFTPRPELAPEQQLRLATAAHLRYLSAHRGLALRLVLGGRGVDPDAWELFEAARWGVLDQMAPLFGLDLDSTALRLVGRAAIGAVDEATVFWLENGEPFDVDTMVEYFAQIWATTLLAVNALDPELDISSAARGLAERTATTD